MPFDLLPDPRFLYCGPSHDTALTCLRYGIESGAGFTVITGDIGAGKTTLIRSILSELTDEFVVGLTTNTHKDFGTLLEWILLSFGLDYKGKSDMERYELLSSFFVECYANSQRVIIIIDEAQKMLENYRKRINTFAKRIKSKGLQSLDNVQAISYSFMCKHYQVCF